jgi:dipeptidyl aminopeptidase/acylaminoacyl peptidase
LRPFIRDDTVVRNWLRYPRVHEHHSKTARIAALTATFEGRALAASTNPALAARLSQNIANHAIVAPLVIAQGLADDVVSPPATDAYVDERCAAGQRLEYWTFTRRDHGGIVSRYVG